MKSPSWKQAPKKSEKDGKIRWLASSDLDGIQRNPAQHARRGVPAAVRRPGVRRLVHADSKQKGDHLKEDFRWIHAIRFDGITQGESAGAFA